MKKVSIILAIFFIFIFKANAASYDSNVSGGVGDTNQQLGDSCNEQNYYILDRGAKYKLQGLRISFYDESGNKVGDTFDEWAWGNISARKGEKPSLQNITTILDRIEVIEHVTIDMKNSGKTSFSSSEASIMTTIRKELEKINSLITDDYETALKNFVSSRTLANLNKIQAQYKIIKPILEKLKKQIPIATNNNFALYIVNRKHNTNYTTKIEYLEKAMLDNEANYSLSKVISSKYYIYYQDLTADSQKYKKNSEYHGPLLYNTQSAEKKELKNYFTTETVMARYLKLANADSIANIKSGNYTMIMEPMITVTGCKNSTEQPYKIGSYTASDMAFLVVKDVPMLANPHVKKVAGWLKLARPETIGGISFTTASGTTFAYDRILSNLGVGMAAILGTEVCRENCTPAKKYQVVYRTIDLNNPFLNQDGTIRTLSNDSNWCEGKNTATNRCDETYVIDTKIYEKEPMLTVVLTPNDIKNIRVDNKTIDYSAITVETCRTFRQNTKFSSIFNSTVDFCN
ncbi:MAG: hypothetical protein IJB71_02000 [Bacilli bacterium]|nr:hypothetical protein [Bacilli bacterium]